jgi:hypothetical protein
MVRDVLDMGLFLFQKTLTRLNSLGAHLLLLELPSLTFRGSLRAAGRNNVLFKSKVVSTDEEEKTK